jgi:N-hydroxyarylamine O-acetyltransferase
VEAVAFDLAGYLRRVGYDGPQEPTLPVLAALALRQPQAIAFENLDAFTGLRPSLGLQDVQRKLVQGGRGGWCFEQNLLLGAALRALGFEVIDLAGRVLWNQPVDAITPRTHRLMRVRAEAGEWLVDAGFGGNTLTGVLDLHSEAEQATPHGPFRLRQLADGERRLEALVAGQWLPAFRFDLQPQLPVDFEAANFQLSHDPASRFTQTLVVSRVVPGGRWVLRGPLLSFYGCDGIEERRELHGVEEVLEVLVRRFGIAVDGLPALPARIGQLLHSG